MAWDAPAPVRRGRAPVVSLTPPSLDQLDELSAERVATGDAAVDRLFGGGFWAGESVLIHGPRGSGKSRCALRWASRAGGLVLSLEMAPALLRHTAASAGAELSRLWVVDDRADWRAAALRCGARVVVVDSVTRLERGAVHWCRDAIGWAQTEGIVLLLISHESKRGRAMGSSSLEHDPDAVLRIENARADGTARLAVRKRRLSPAGSCRVELVPGALDRLKCRGKRLQAPAEQEPGSECDRPRHEPPERRHRGAPE